MMLTHRNMETSAILNQGRMQASLAGFFKGRNKKSGTVAARQSKMDM
eukprot:CAMPEP_0172706764 /NCGR_PEP_ID=MMETSP1074-20121228/46997_1 /TAXON_ID=2916 /ORGANISM="Ceratium fusus, Strain PA161109" /LENGTH=46 /DNA_ID= /DNA_START= /DNA_END= /DNA_ORIENTATION=